MNSTPIVIDFEEIDSGPHWLREVRDRKLSPQSKSAPKSTCGAGAPGSPGFQEGNTCARRDRSPERKLVGSRSDEINVLGGFIFDELDSKGHVSIVGREVTSAIELIELAQVYRDPRYETFRAVFIKDGVVVGQNTYTVREPSMVPVNDAVVDDIESDVGDLGATNFYIMHNHPTGDPTPSGPDVSATQRFADHFGKSFSGHVVINHNRAAEIDTHGNVIMHEFDNDDLLDPDNAAVPHELLGTKLESAPLLAKTAMRLAKQDRAVAIFVDAKSKIRLLFDFDSARIAGVETKDTKVVAAVRRMRAMTGAGSHRVVILPKGMDSDDAESHAKKLIESDLVTDVMIPTASGEYEAASATIGVGWDLFRLDKYIGKQIAEEYRSTSKTNCGAGAKGNPGFQHGNTCAKLRRGYQWASHNKESGKFVTEDGVAVEHYIPPSWTDVQVATDPNADLVAIGKDAKGRTQRIYSKAHWDRMAEKKFAKVSELVSIWASIGRKLRRDVSNGDEAAAIALLIWKTGMRPGSNRDTKADKKAYGAATLEARHVSINGNRISIEYTGKHGVARHVKFTDSKLAAMLSGLTDGKAPTDRVFSVSPRTLRRYIDRRFGEDVNPKDFRTALGTIIARKAAQKAKRAATMKAYKATVKQIAKRVANALGNTPAVALQSYIDPRVFKGLQP